MIPLYIIDVNKSQGAIDWDALAQCKVDFVQIKASGLYKNQGDPEYARNVAGAVSHGVPFHVFHFLYCLTEAEARRDAGLFYRTVAGQGHWPLFWVLDCEAGWGIKYSRAKPVAEAFEAELRRLARENGPGEIRVALYIGHNRYKEYALDYGHYDYLWIPRYGSNDGTLAGSIPPDWPCDLWQYTSNGQLPGIKGIGRVDMSVLNGDKPLGFFTGEEDTNMATVYVYGASIDENGNAHGGKAGNQTGRELRKQKWYKHTKGWRVFRAKTAEVAAKIAQCAKAAVANMHIGYDQYQRNTLYEEAKKYGFDVSKVTKDVECDCSALVRVCCAYAGITGLPEDFRTGNMPKNLLATGAFTEMTGTRYTDSYTYLKEGDILVTATSGHTVVVGNDGAKAEASPLPAAEGLRRGDYGTAVTAMQQALLKWDAKCLPKYGADGDFGAETEKAVKAYQQAAGLPVTGVYDEATRAKLTGAQPAPAPTVQMVEITGGTVNVRAAPGTVARQIGYAHKGDVYDYGGLTTEIDGRDWYLIDYNNTNGWVSSKYARLM